MTKRPDAHQKAFTSPDDPVVVDNETDKVRLED